MLAFGSFGLWLFGSLGKVRRRDVFRNRFISILDEVKELNFLLILASYFLLP
jgi:hypothetical protein